MIRCAHCKNEEGRGSHETVGQVRLCAANHGVPIRAPRSTDPRSATEASAAARADQLAWKAQYAAREAQEEREAYRAEMAAEDRQADQELASSRQGYGWR